MEEKKKIYQKKWFIVMVIVIFTILVAGITVLICKLPDIINKTEESSSDIEVNKNLNDIDIQELLNALQNVTKENEQVQENINPKDIIRIKSITTSEPNYANGVDLEIEWTNMSDKVIKYITFTAYPINAVGDIVECNIRTLNRGQFKGQETGPIEKGKGNKEGYVFQNAWYNNTIVKAMLMQIDIEYMDGTKVKLDSSQIDEVIY